MTTTLHRPADTAPPVNAAGLTTLFRFRPDAVLTRDGATVEIRHHWGGHRLSGLTDDDIALLVAMTSGPVAAKDLPAGRLRPVLSRLANLIVATLTDRQGRTLLTVTPIGRSAGAWWTPSPAEPPGAIALAGLPEVATLSRFALLRRLPTHPEPLVLESPRAAHRLGLRDQRMIALVGGLVSGTAVSEAAHAAGLSSAEAAEIVGVLDSTGFLETGEDQDALRLWDFHDLLFQNRSRYGLHDYPAGAVFAHQDSPHATAVQQPENSGDAIDLAVPSWNEVVAADRTLTETLENRRSVRSYGQAAITLDQLAELLYRTARARALGWATGDPPYHAVDRPYPMGGSLGELELYLVVHRCDGLVPGVYRYDAAGHRLFPRESDPVTRRHLRMQAELATGGLAAEPQIQMCITSRLDRVQWKYSAIGYALTLKHVGVLFQNLYLVATAMGLSPCANGSGDTDLISRGIGVDWITEPPVGEFLLGGAPQENLGVVTDFADIVGRTRNGAEQ